MLNAQVDRQLILIHLSPLITVLELTAAAELYNTEGMIMILALTAEVMGDYES